MLHCRFCQMRLIFPFRFLCNFPAQKVFLCPRFSSSPCLSGESMRFAGNDRKEPVTNSAPLLSRKKRLAGFILLRYSYCPAKRHISPCFSGLSSKHFPSARHKPHTSPSISARTFPFFQKTGGKKSFRLFLLCFSYSPISSVL